MDALQEAEVCAVLDRAVRAVMAASIDAGIAIPTEIVELDARPRMAHAPAGSARAQRDTDG